MPVGTYGSVKGLTPKQLNEIGFDVILENFSFIFTTWFRCHKKIQWSS